MYFFHFIVRKATKVTPLISHHPKDICWVVCCEVSDSYKALIISYGV